MLAACAIQGIDSTILSQGGNHATLPWDDDHRHVVDHDGADHLTVVNERASSTEQLTQTPCDQYQESEQHHGQCAVISAQRRLAQLVVNDPPTDQIGRSDTDGCTRAHRTDRGIDQIYFGAQLVDEDQQENA